MSLIHLADRGGPKYPSNEVLKAVTTLLANEGILYPFQQNYSYSIVDYAIGI